MNIEDLKNVIKVCEMNLSTDEFQSALWNILLNMELFFKIEKKYPKWNLQESNKSWPEYIQKSRNTLLNESINVKLKDVRCRVISEMRNMKSLNK